jgi:hypothetical protein
MLIAPQPKAGVMPLSMKKLAIIIILVVGCASAFAQSERVGAFRFQTKKAGHSARVIFHIKAFDPKKNVSYDPKIGNTVNGQKAYGAELTPEAEIASVKLFFDGRQIKIPAQLYSDCYDPNLRDNPLTIRFGRDLQTVLVSMGGSDGAGGYRVTWVFRTNGRHTRFFD